MPTATPTPVNTHRPTTVTQAPAGGVRLGIDGATFTDLTPGEAEQLGDSLRLAAYQHAPQLEHVIGAPGHDATEVEVLTPDQVAAAQEAGADDLVHGLRCPHPGCRFVTWETDDDGGVIVVDGDERWSHLHYEIRQVPELDPTTKGYVTDEAGRKVWRPAQPTGRIVEQRVITGWYSDRSADWEGIGYRCNGCTQPVRLPDDVEEAGQS